MNRQNFTEKFPKLKRHWNDQLIVVANPDEAEWMSVDYPVHLWHQTPELRILVITSNMPLAGLFAERSRRVEPPSMRAFSRHRITNEEGGVIQYCSPEVALMGSRFDRIIISDPMFEHPYGKRIAEWLQVLQCRLVPQ